MRIQTVGPHALTNSKGALKFALGITDRTGTDDASGHGAGAWNGKTLQLQYKTPDGDFVDHPDGQFSANVVKHIDAVGAEYQLVSADAVGLDVTVTERPLS